jgi:hypothetical protein
MPGRASTLRRAACVTALLATLQGCATTGQPGQQSIWIDTPECPYASCQLRNDRGQWALERTPGRVTVTTSSAPLEVAFHAGELSTHASAPSTVPPVRGGAATVERAGNAPTTPTVALRVTRYDYRDRLHYFIVIPIGGLLVPGKSQLDLQLAIELRLLDVDGAVLWSNVYDSGLRIWEPLKRPLFEAPEKHFEGLVRLTHETAFALMRDASRDVGEWLRNERLRERPL